MAHPNQKSFRERFAAAPLTIKVNIISSALGLLLLVSYAFIRFFFFGPTVWIKTIFWTCMIILLILIGGVTLISDYLIEQRKKRPSDQEKLFKTLEMNHQIPQDEKK
jgi:membrane protein YdbS with pleckstrin-like domain